MSSVILLHLRRRAALDLDDLHREDQAAGDTAVVTVGQAGGDVHLPLVALDHELHRLRPAFDDLVRGEGGRRAAVVGGIELGAAWPVFGAAPFVVALARGVGKRVRIAVTSAEHLVLKAGCKGDDTLLLGFVREELLVELRAATAATAAAAAEYGVDPERAGRDGVSAAAKERVQQALVSHAQGNAVDSPNASPRPSPPSSAGFFPDCTRRPPLRHAPDIFDGRARTNNIPVHHEEQHEDVVRVLFEVRNDGHRVERHLGWRVFVLGGWRHGLMLDSSQNRSR